MLGITTRVNTGSTIPRSCSSYIFWSVPANQAGSGSTWSNDPNRRNTPLRVPVAALLVSYDEISWMYLCNLSLYFLLYLSKMLHLTKIFSVILKLITLTFFFRQLIPIRLTETHIIAIEIFCSVWYMMLRQPSGSPSKFHRIPAPRIQQSKHNFNLLANIRVLYIAWLDYLEKQWTNFPFPYYSHKLARD